MRAILLGGAIAVLAVGIFLVGEDRGWFEDPQGPAEQVGEAIDEGVNDLERSAEDATD